MEMSKIYEIFIQDEWNNLTLMGFYNHLDDSIKDINNFIHIYCEGRYQLSEGMLKEYPGTYGSCIDVSLGDLFNLYEQDKQEDIDEIGCVMIRGFILDLGELLENV